MEQIAQELPAESNDFDDHTTVCNKEESGRLKLKYTKHSVFDNGLDGTKIKIQKYNSKDLVKLKEKYRKKKSVAHVAYNLSCTVNDKQSNIDTDNGIANRNESSIGDNTKSKHRKHKKPKNNSDPEVLNISDMMSSNLLIESPDNVTIQNNTSNSITKNDEQISCPITVNETDKLSAKDTSSNIEPLDQNNDSNSKNKNVLSSITMNETDKVSANCTPNKMNAFQFMMNSRFNVIGNNIGGKDKKEIEGPEEDVFEKKKVLNKRKAMLENWAEQKSPALKRKQQDEAQEKYITRTLNKRAKRLKKILSVPDKSADVSCDGLLNDDSSSSDIDRYVKSSKNRNAILTDSESSNDANSIKLGGNMDSEQKKISSDVPHEDGTSVSKENVQNSSHYAGKRKSMDDFVVKQGTTTSQNLNTQKKIDKQKTDGDFTDEKNQISATVDMKNKDDKEIIKVKLNFTPRKSKLINGTPQENSPKSKKTTRIGRKSSLSLKKNNESVKSNIDISESAIQAENILLSDNDEIFPTNMNLNKRPVAVKKNLISSQDLHVDNSNVEENNVKSTPWRMRVKLSEKEHVSDVENVDVTGVCVISDESPPQTQTDKMNKTSLTSSNINSEKKQVKLAPIFIRKSKRQDAVSLQAKKDFLHSGLPSSIKKTVPVQPSVQEIEYELFPKISHVQQIEESLSIFWDLPNASLCLSENFEDSCAELYYNKINIGSFSNCKSVNTTLTNRQLHAPPAKIQNIKQLIRELKGECPDYPVYKIFRLLREKCNKCVNDSEIVTRIDVKPKETAPKKRPRGRPKKKEIVLDDRANIRSEASELISSAEVNVSMSTCMWSEQYKPQSREDIMGNSSVVNELKLWLESWVTYSEDKKSRKRKRMNSNSSDDFCTDSDTRDTDSSPQNTILLIGAHGSGKTSAVYALCNEFNINVIEINASSKRPGKKILNDLQEATQSHQVKNTDSKSTSNFFHKTADKKSKSEDDLNKKLSLLLVEDIDIVFEDQDEGLISALVSLASTSKRPIILTSADPTSSHLQKFISQHRVLTFSALSGKILGTWLQILCLVEGVHVSRDILVQLLQWNKGDVRKTLLQLQFWVQTGGDQLKSNESIITNNISKFIKITSNCSNSVNIDGESYQDETSNLSWLSGEDNKTSGGKESNYVNHSCVQCFVPYYERDTNNFQIPYPVNLGLYWWNIPRLLRISNIKHATDMREENVLNNDQKPVDFSNIISQLTENETLNTASEDIDNFIVSPELFEGTQEQQNQMKQCPQKELADLIVAANVLDRLAFADTMYSKMKLECDLEPTLDYWDQYPVDSLSFKENMTGYDDSYDLSMDITHWLLNSTVQKCETIDNTTLTNTDFNIALPDPENIRWRSRQHKAMEAVSSIVPTSSLLDRKALCTDYHSTFRSISRMENTRFNNNSKRKNRFFHYFKSINIHLPDSVYKVLNNALTTDKDTV